MRWMKAGDFRPLLAAIRKTGLLRGPTLGLLAEMLETGQLAFKKGRGRRHDPEAAVRDQFAADTYEHFSDPDDDGVKAVMRSDDLFSTIGSVISKSEESVRQAVTSRRKPKRR